MTTIQVAILFPVLLLWLMLIVQYGLWWHAKQVANGAAAEAVEAAQLEAATAADGKAAASQYLAESGNLDNIRVSVTRSAEAVVAEVRGDAPHLVLGFSWSVTARSEGPVERFIPEPDR